ncbi:MAG: nucleotide exchange factor GrpE [Actinobacteria bacterium]|nr:nucleotide exchange factor GrpE [Actinomycetota bacterium]
MNDPVSAPLRWVVVVVLAAVVTLRPSAGPWVLRIAVLGLAGLAVLPVLGWLRTVWFTPVATAGLAAYAAAILLHHGQAIPVAAAAGAAAAEETTVRCDRFGAATYRKVQRMGGRGSFLACPACRMTRDVRAAEARGMSRLAKELLPALDNLERAIAAVEASDDQREHHLTNGIRLVQAELSAALGRGGIQRYAAKGERFDPVHHEAVAQAPVDGAEPGTIVEVLQSGYRLNDLVLRPARVIVAG